jgi:hypothetical protein
MAKKITRRTQSEIESSLRRGAKRTLILAAVVAGSMGGAVVTDGVSFSVYDNVAFSKGGNGGGKGGGGGRGGGRGGGNKGGQGDVAGGGPGKGQAKGHAHGHAKSHGLGHANERNNGASNPPGAPSLGDEPASKNGISAAALGSLNAAHASSTARENASPNSMVGQIAAFADAVESENINAAAEALAVKANKSITEPVVTEVARLVGVEVSEENASAIATRAAEIQSGDNQQPGDGETPGDSDSQEPGDGMMPAGS